MKLRKNVKSLFVRAWIFEVFVDKMRVLGNMSLPEAIAALLHIPFVFNLRYVKV